MWFVDAEAIEDIAIGAGILGTGGGGSPYVGKLMVLGQLARGARLAVVEPEEVADEATCISLGGMGAPIVSVEKFAGRWHFKVRHKRREDWSKPSTLTRAMWEELLDGLERRLPRREGTTEADVAAVKKILNEWPAD